MILRYGEDHFIIPDLLEGKPAVIAPKTDKPQFDFAIQDVFDDTRRIADPKDRFYFWILHYKSAQLGRQQVLTWNIAAANPKLPAERAVELLNRSYCFSFKRQQILCP